MCKYNYQSNHMTFLYSNFFYLKQQSFVVQPNTCQCGSSDNREVCKSRGLPSGGTEDGGRGRQGEESGNFFRGVEAYTEFW